MSRFQPTPAAAVLALLAALPAQQAGLPAAPATASTTVKSAEPPAKPQPATIRGRLRDTAGKPLAGIAIGFGPERSLVTAAVLQHPTATSDAEGRFELTVAPPEDTWRNAYLHFVGKGFAGALHAAAPNYDRDKKEYATAKDFGDLILIPGGRLVGRVRDADGKPLPGARIVARDLFDGSRNFRGRTHNVFCAATADPGGIFDLPCAVAQAARLEVTLDGYYARALTPVSSATPLEITLEPSGFLAGRVLDAEGRGVEGALVTVGYEVRGPADQGRSGPGGTFRLTLSQPARFRVSASVTRDNVALSGRSAVSSGPQGNLEIYLKAPENRNQAETGELVVQAIDQKTRAPVAEFTALAMWEQYANQNPNYFEWAVHQNARNGARAKDGAATVNGPAKNNANLGIVRVLARGYAPGTVRDLEWKDPGPGESRAPVVVELAAESVLAGKVVDEATGEAVAGARVWARPQQNRNLGYYPEPDQPPPEAVTTAADGTYALPMLGEGGYDVYVRHEQRPKMPSVTVELAAGDHKNGFDLKIPAGAAVQVTLTGAEIGPGWRAFLQDLPDFNPAMGGGTRFFGAGNDPPNGIDVPADGKLRWQGLKLGDYRLVLSVPSPPRCGGQVFLPVEPFRVRRGGVERQVDLAHDRPGHVRGTIRFPADGVPFDRVIVTARQVADDQNPFFGPYQNDWPGPRAFVDRGGAFDLLLGPGRYTLELVDIQTGLRLHGTAQPLLLESAGSVKCDLAPVLVQVRIALEPEQAGNAAVADRLEVRVAAKDHKLGGRPPGGNDNYDQGNGFDLEPGQKEVQLVVPPADVTLFVRNSVVNVRTDDQRYNVPPLARLEFEAVAGDKGQREFTVKVPPPPEIPADEARKSDDAAGADGTRK